MRYVIALTVCCLLLGSFLVNHWWVEDSIAIASRSAREKLGLAPDAPLTDFGIPVSRNVLVGLEVDRLFLRFWFVIVPAIVALCFVPAAMKEIRRKMISTEPAR